MSMLPSVEELREQKKQEMEEVEEIENPQWYEDDLDRRRNVAEQLGREERDDYKK